MNAKISELSKYSRDDIEKLSLIEEVYDSFPRKDFCLKAPLLKMSYSVEADIIEDACYSRELKEEIIEYGKYCPQCGRKYPLGENVCLDCLVHLKKISDKIVISQIESKPQFTFDGDDSFDTFDALLTRQNLTKVKEFDFNIARYSKILHDIKSQAFKNFDNLVKDNKINFDELNILEKILLFAKSFVQVDYKASGEELGYFEDGRIIVDDRQTKSLMITTLIHELSHFLIHEILTHILCSLLDCRKNSIVSSVVAFILSYTPFTQLIDEYSAHNVEGRFTIFGFQDYSSYIQIERSLNGEMSADEIEITKSIANTFALSIKEILEALIDEDLREDIKEQFLSDVMDRPNYSALKMENCQILNDEGFIRAIWLILNDGFEVACLNVDNFSAK